MNVSHLLKSGNITDLFSFLGTCSGGGPSSFKIILRWSSSLGHYRIIFFLKKKKKLITLLFLFML